jgi:quinol monooxygenase YgiN
MVIVAGDITVKPKQRESYLAGCMSVVEQARRAAGCLDFAITADLIDPGRVNLFERWESQAAVETFRSSAPRNKQAAARTVPRSAGTRDRLVCVRSASRRSSTITSWAFPSPNAEHTPAMPPPTTATASRWAPIAPPAR